MPAYHFFCGKCQHRQILETQKTVMHCNLCGKMVNQNGSLPTGRYSRDWARRRKPLKKPPIKRYSPPPGKTKISRAPKGELIIDRGIIWEPEPVHKNILLSKIIPLILAAVGVGAIAFILLKNPEISSTIDKIAETGIGSILFGDGNSNKDACQDFHSKIQSVGQCYGQQGCPYGSSWCEVKPYSNSWGQGCVPNECR